MDVNFSCFRLERHLLRSKKKIESLRFNEAYDRSVRGGNRWDENSSGIIRS